MFGGGKGVKLSSGVRECKFRKIRIYLIIKILGRRDITKKKKLRDICRFFVFIRVSWVMNLGGIRVYGVEG